MFRVRRLRVLLHPDPLHSYVKGSGRLLIVSIDMEGCTRACSDY